MGKKRARVFVTFALVSLLASMLVTPAQAGTSDDSHTIERYHVSAPTLQSTTSNLPQTAVSLSFTPSDDKNFVILASALTNNANTGYHTEVTLDIDGTDYSLTQHKPVDIANNWYSFGTHKVIPCTGGQTYNLKIEYRTSDGTGTYAAYVKRVSIHVLEVGANMEYAESEGENSTSLTTYVTKTKLTFTTPATPASQDYLILATANLRQQTAGKSTLIQLTKDEVPAGAYEHEGTLYSSCGSGMMDTLTASTEYSYEIQWCKDVGAGDAYIKSARLTAIPMPDLGDSEYAASEGENFTSLAAYGAANTKVTLTVTPTHNTDWLVIPMALGRQENTAYAYYNRLYLDDTTSYDDFAFRPAVKASYRNWYQPTKIHMEAGSHSLKIQYRSSNAGSNSEAFIKRARITAINVNTAESYDSNGDFSDSYGIGEDYARIRAYGLQASTNYKVAYYDAGDNGGQNIGIDSNPVSGPAGNISSLFLLSTNESAAAGTWHAVVFSSGASVPTNYNDVAASPDYIVVDSFNVAQSQIPEFPTVAAASTAMVLSIGIYFWMRKRRTAYVYSKN